MFKGDLENNENNQGGMTVFQSFEWGELQNQHYMNSGMCTFLGRKLEYWVVYENGEAVLIFPAEYNRFSHCLSFIGKIIIWITGI